MKLDQKDHTWRIQGMDVADIRKAFGSPLYVYDAQGIENQVAIFRESFKQAKLKIKYACKALTNINILKLMLRNGTGLDTVSIPEVKMGLEAGFKPHNILFTPNCVSFDEIEQAVNLGVCINIDNISNLEKFAQKYSDTVPVCIRLNPMVQTRLNSEKVWWWHNQSKFGISIDKIGRVQELQNKHQLKVNGLHIHSSSVIMNTEVFLEAAKAVFEVAQQFDQLEFIDFGGGIKTDVGDGNEVIDIQMLGSKLDLVFRDFCKQYGRELEMWFEPGRYLVGNAGYLFTTCVVLKQSGNTQFAGVDSGFNHLIRPMFYNAYHQVINASNPKGAKQAYHVVGNICEIDNLAVDRQIENISEGDLLIFKDAGAYGYSMASTYNSRYRPAEVLVINGEAHLIRRADSYEDLMRNQLLIDDIGSLN